MWDIARRPSATWCSVPHHPQEVLQPAETHVHVAALFVANGRSDAVGIVMPGIEHGVVRQLLQLVDQAVVYLRRITAGQVDAAAAADEERVAGDQTAVDE